MVTRGQTRETASNIPPLAAADLGGGGGCNYASQADSLLTQLRRGDPDALQRLRASVPRYAAATDASTAELRDARLIAGFPP